MNKEAILLSIQSLFFCSAIFHLLLATVLWEPVSKKMIDWYFEKVISRIGTSEQGVIILKNNAKNMLYFSIFVMFSIWLLLLTEAAQGTISSFLNQLNI